MFFRVEQCTLYIVFSLCFVNLLDGDCHRELSITPDVMQTKCKLGGLCLDAEGRSSKVSRAAERNRG